MGRPRSSTPVRTATGWQVSVPAATGSRRRVQRTFTTKAEASAWLRACHTALDAGTALPDPAELAAPRKPNRSSELSGSSFADVAADWVQERYVLMGRGQQSRQDSVQAAIRNHHQPFMDRHGFSDGSQITRAAYRAYLSDLAYGTGSATATHVLDGDVSLAEAVELTGASRSTLKRRLADGSLSSAYLDQRGTRRIPISDLARAGLLSGEALRRGPRIAGKGYSPDVVADLRRTLDGVLAHGVATAGWVLQFDPQSVPTPVNRDHETRRAQVTLEQCAAMAVHLHVVHQVALWLMRILSLRISEAFGIRVGDLVDDGDVLLLRVHRQGGRKFRSRDRDGNARSNDESEHLKTKTSHRVLVVPPVLADLIRTVIAVFHTGATGTVRTDARLIPGLKKAGAGGQGALRTALRNAASAAGITVGPEWDPDEALLPAPKDLRAGAITDMAWNAVPEVVRKRFAGHAAGSDVHSRSYILDSRDLAPLQQAAQGIHERVLASCPDGLMIPTVESCTTRNQPLLHQDKARIDAALRDLKWFVCSTTEAGEPTMSAEEAATVLGRSPQTVRRWAAREMFPTATKHPADGLQVPASEVQSLAQHLQTRCTLHSVAAAHGLSYHQVWTAARQAGITLPEDSVDRVLLVTPEAQAALDIAVTAFTVRLAKR